MLSGSRGLEIKVADLRGLGPFSWDVGGLGDVWGLGDWGFLRV